MLKTPKQKKSVEPGNRIRAGQLRISPETRFYISLLLALVFYLLASNIGSGWVLFLSAATICCCLFSIALPLLLLKNTSLEILAAETVDAGDEIPLHIRFYVPKALKPLARFMILNTVPPSSSIFSAEKNPRRSVLISSPDSGALVESSSPGLKRGIRPLSPLQIESSYPLGLSWVKAVYPSRQNIAVLPKTEPVEGSFLYRLSSSVYVPGGTKVSRQGFQSASARGVRHYVRGDSRRHIHWNLSARHGQLMVKELEHEGLAAFDIVFDMGANWQNEEQFELAITAVASLLKLGHSLGIHPDLFIPERVLSSTERLGSPLSQDLDQQFLALAALDFEKSGAKGQSQMKCSSKQAFSARQRAVVLVCPHSDDERNSESQEEKSRNTVFILSIHPELNAGRQSHASSSGFVLCGREALHSL